MNDLFEYVGVLARRRHQQGDAEFRKIGLQHTEARLLSLLHKEGGVAPQDVISQVITIDRSNVGRALQSLEQRGYLHRRQHFADKRAKVVALTEKGKEAAEQIDRIRREMAETFFGDLTDRQAQEILEVLKRATGEGER